MRYSEQPLQTFRLRNFKAVRDSGVVKFTPLTVFIGNNGCGKSSLIEGLETFQSIVTEGIDEAMNRWRGFEFIWNTVNLRREVEKENKKKWALTDGEIYRKNSMKFDLKSQDFDAFMSLGLEHEDDEVDYLEEKFKVKSGVDGINQSYPYYGVRRSVDGEISSIDEPRKVIEEAAKFESSSIFGLYGGSSIASWQFLSLNPDQMGEARFAKRFGNFVRLQKDGANVADYLSEILDIDEKVFLGIVNTLQYVLPYAKDIDSTMTYELGRQRYLQLSEGEFRVPGWLLSTGTLRVLALLAVLRHPDPPPLLCIEEIENGLDPRTLNLIVEEIQRVTRSGKTQVICTTHS
ncbi:MAG: chromosome segregation protein SMC, partial [Proteobacteria bacterium]